MSISVPKTIGRYTIIREIARSNDIVFEAWDDHLNRRVALKLLQLPKYAPQSDINQRVTRFQREARAAASLSHPNVAAVYDFGVVGDEYFIVMEFVEGQTLRQILESKGTLASSEASSVIEQVLLALGCAHKSGVIHRDVKPENIFVSGGVVKLADFGIARIESEQSITMTGQVFGTPFYMSPEHALGKEVGIQTDLWSAGVVLFEMCTGSKPFLGSNFMEIWQKVGSETPEFSKIWDADCRIVAEGLLQKDLAVRFKSTSEALLALKAAVPVTSSARLPPPIRIKPVRGKWSMMTGLIVIIAGVLGFYSVNAVLSNKQPAPINVANNSAAVVLPPTSDRAAVDAVYDDCADRKSFAMLTDAEDFSRVSEEDQKDRIDTWARQNVPTEYFKLTDLQRTELVERLRMLGNTAKAPVANNQPINPPPNQSSNLATNNVPTGLIEPAANKDSNEVNSHSNNDGVDTRERAPERIGKHQGTSRPLKSIPEVSGPAPDSNFFTLGSTEDDVLSIQGTPTQITGSGKYKTFHYNYSDVSFVDGLVSSYDNRSHNLKIRVSGRTKGN